MYRTHHLEERWDYRSRYSDSRRRGSYRRRSRSRCYKEYSLRAFASRTQHRYQNGLRSIRRSISTRNRKRSPEDYRSFFRSFSRSSENSDRNRKRKEGANGRGTDTDGAYTGQVGDIIGKYYEVCKDLGTGTFGRVVECVDRRNQRKVAIKVVRRVKRYYESAEIEADILSDINSQGERGISHCVQLIEHFDMIGHYCLVFERMGCSLYDLLKKNDYCGLPITMVNQFSYQLLDTIAFLHDLGLVHTDLKPENILLCDTDLIETAVEISSTNKKKTMLLPSSSKIKVIDFGGATYVDDHKSSTVNTRQYRAPEVILGIGWCKPSDLWSSGCIISELYHGELLFATHDNMEHLGLMERCVGYFPRRVVSISPHCNKYFDSKYRSRWREKCSEDSQEHIRSMPSIEKLVSRADRQTLGELLKGLLTLDPSERLTAADALKATFFSSNKKIMEDSK